MCCKCCGVTQRQIWVFGSGTVFVALGIIILVLWPGFSEQIVYKNLILKEGSDSYESWVEAPIPIYLEFHMFNWTNPEEIRNPNVKPNFVEMGPYIFLEKHFKENITFYPNDTVSYYQKRFWYFDKERSNGTLQDMVTAAHVITATVADEMRHKNMFTKKIINFILNHEGGELYTTKPAGEWIFDGYEDRLIDFLKLFNTSRIDIPYTKFAWLADRNGSAEYDGLFTIHTGNDDISNLGRLTHWNKNNVSGYYEPPCGKINGTTGDLFPPHMNPNEEITIYATDACRYMNLAPKGTVENHGLEAIKYVGTIETLDSGENYPNQKCFCNPLHEECPKTGVVDCKKCRHNAPIYASFPHFYLADESYKNAVTGMNPDPKIHEFALSIEPFTGIPLFANARLQINMMIQPDDDFDIYRGVPKFLMPMFWFEQKAILDEKLAGKAKLAINLGSYGQYFGITSICVGGAIFLIGLYLTFTKKWKCSHEEDEDILTT